MFAMSSNALTKIKYSFSTLKLIVENYKKLFSKKNYV